MSFGLMTILGQLPTECFIFENLFSFLLQIVDVHKVAVSEETKLHNRFLKNERAQTTKNAMRKKIDIRKSAQIICDQIVLVLFKGNETAMARHLAVKPAPVVHERRMYIAPDLRGYVKFMAD